MKQFENLLIAVQNNLPVSVVTMVKVPAVKIGLEGQMLVFYPDGRVEGCIVNKATTGQIIEYIKNAKWEQPLLFELEELNGYQFFWDKWDRSRKAVVFGGGHISQPLVELLAMLDFEVTVVDDRVEFANFTRFPHANKVICDNFPSALAGDAISVDESTAVIIVTRGHRYDLECLRQLTDTKAGYIGMIGSRRRVKGIIDLLTNGGTPSDWLQRLRSPIGIDIGATTPTEIALSIVVEVMAVFNASSLKPLSLGQKGDLHG